MSRSALRKLATVFASRPDDTFHGYPLSREANVSPGQMYPLLRKFLDAGWLSDGWTSSDGQRQPRRYYRVTYTGSQCFAYLARRRSRS